MFLILILDTKNNDQLYSLLWESVYFFIFHINILPLSEQRLILCLYEP